MKQYGLLAIGVGLLGAMSALAGDSSASKDKSATEAKSVYDFTMKDIDGKDIKLSDYKGKVVMIVNVASQ